MANRMFRDTVENAARQMAECVAAEYIAAEQNYVNSEHQTADANAEAVREPVRFPGIPDQKAPNDVREPKEVTVQILHNQRKRALAQISFARLADRAGRRIGPECLVVRAAIVIAGQAKEAGNPKNKQRGRERQETGIPRGLGAEPGVRRIAEDFGRIKRRDIGPVSVIAVLECGPRGVNDK